jgi:hypothetical protein
MSDNPDPIPVDTIHVLCARCGQPFKRRCEPSARRTISPPPN